MKKFLFVLLVSLDAVLAQTELPCRLSVERHGDHSILITLNNPQSLRVAVQSCYDLSLPNNDHDKWGYLFSTTNSIQTFTNGYIFNFNDKCFYRVVLWPDKYPHIPLIPAPENP